MSDPVDIVAKARELAAKAMPGAWRYCACPPYSELYAVLTYVNKPDCRGHVSVAEGMLEQDAEFIAAARELVPQLCDELEDARDEAERANARADDYKRLCDSLREQRDYSDHVAAEAKAEVERLRGDLAGWRKLAEMKQDLARADATLDEIRERFGLNLVPQSDPGGQADAVARDTAEEDE